MTEPLPLGMATKRMARTTTKSLHNIYYVTIPQIYV